MKTLMKVDQGSSFLEGVSTSNSFSEMTWNTELEPKRLQISLTVSVRVCLSLFVSNLSELILLLSELSVSFREL